MTTATFTEEYRTIDKAEWGDGPWMAEPDKAVWVDDATGLDCLIVRNRLGALCGYVGVPVSHPFHGKDYDACGEPDCDATHCGADEHPRGPGGSDVHGGLTFANKCQPDAGDHSTGICHIPQPGRPDDVWWFGFDTAHGLDYVPGMAAREKKFMPQHLQMTERADCVYRDLLYVISEVEGLARQLVEVAS